MTTEYESNLTPDQAKSLVDLKAVEAAMMTKHDELVATIEKATAEAKDAGSVSADTKSTVDGIAEQLNAIGDRIHQIEQKGAHEQGASEPNDIGSDFIKSDAYKSLTNPQNPAGRARMEMKTAIINATGQNQPLVPADRASGIIHEPNRMLRIRDILNATGTNSNLIEFAKENVFTNNAAAQYASPAYENVTKAESGITFTLASEAVQTIAHWIPASKQVIDDSQQLQGYISGRLTYGLKLKEETQLLLGSGASGQLNGLYTQATAYTVQSPALTNKLDIIREAIKQAQLSEYMPTNIVLNPQDWYEIDVSKVGTSDDRYVVGNPREMSVPRLWGLPVVLSNSITAGTFLLGAFDMGAEIKDRQQSTVEVSRENSDNFVKNMITILAEERIALVVYRPAAFIKGSF